MNLFWAFPHVKQKFHGNGSETSTRLLTEKNSCKLRLGWVNQLWWFKYLQISTGTKLVWKFPWRIRRIWKMGNYVSKETCCHLSIWLPIWFYNIDSQCGCLEDYFPFGMAYFQQSSGSLIFDPWGANYLQGSHWCGGSWLGAVNVLILWKTLHVYVYVIYIYSK